MLGDRDHRSAPHAGGASPLWLALRTTVPVTLREILTAPARPGAVDDGPTEAGELVLRDLPAGLPNEPHTATQSSN